MAGEQGRDEPGRQGVTLQLAKAAPTSPGAPVPGPGRMRSEIESMRGFKARVDALLEELTGSDADSGRLGQEGMMPTTMGGGFLEASVLHQGYEQVLQQLTQLSHMMSGQVGGLGTAVRAASNGYEGVDEDARRRMWAIQKRAESRYEAKLDPYAVRNEDGSYDTEGGKPQGAGEGGL